MATATWFDYNAYMANKLVQVNAIDPKVQYTPETLKAEFEKAGYVGEEGAFKHFEQYGKTEDVAPNALFDADEYITAKAADFFKTDKPTASQIAEVAKAFADGGMSAWDHYVAYGSSEGVEPSFSFNTDAYLTAKAAALNAGKYDGKENWTAEDVAAAIKASGSTVLEHFMANGGGGAYEVVDSYEDVIKEGALNPFEDLTPPTPVPDPNPGDTFTLGTGPNKIPGTEKDDIINGLSSGLSSENTLHAKDTIDGGEGIDTLNLTMKSSFGGFDAKEGFMKSVEVVNLSNTTTSEKTFNAAKISDVQEYNIDASKGGIKLTNLADTKAAISLKGQQSGEFSIGYADKVTDGADDSLSLTVEGVGKEATDTAEAVAVNVKTAGIETVNLAAKGTNVISFSADSGVKNLSVKGTGDLTVDSVSTALTALDARAASGKLNIDVTAATQVKAVALGGNDDVLVADAGGLLATAIISGGNGNDTLVLNSAAAANLALNMDGVETLSLGEITTDPLTFSAKNVSGLNTIEVTEGVAQAVTIARLGEVDMNINLTGENTNATAAITTDNAGVSKVAVSSDDKDHTAAEPATNGVDVTLSKSSSVEFTVAGNMEYKGAVTAIAAESFSLAAEGILTASTLTLNKATSADMTFSGNAASTIAINAAKLESLDITTSKGLTLTGTTANTELMSLQQLTVETDGAFTAGTTQNIVLSKLNSANLLGEGSVTLGSIGSTTLADYGVSIVASGLNGGLTLDTVNTKGTDILIDGKNLDGGLTLGVISADNGAGAKSGNVEVHVGTTAGTLSAGITGKSINFDASEVISGGTTYGSMSAYESLTFTGSDTLANEVTGVATGTTGTVNMSLTGGMGADKFTVTNHSDFDGKVDISAVGNGGTDILTLNGIATHGLTINSLSVTDINVATSGTVDFSAMKSGVTAASAAGTFIGGIGEDVVTLATGALRFDGGKGKDTVTLGAKGTTDVTDTIVLRSKDKADADTIINFATGSDSIEFGSELSAFRSNNGAAKVTDQSNTDDIIVAGSAGYIVVVSDAFAGANEASGLVHLFSEGDAMKNLEFIVTSSTGGHTYVWYAKDNGDGIIKSDEIQLMGTFNDVAAGDISTIFKMEADAS